jgi:hypothetical protein
MNTSTERDSLESTNVRVSDTVIIRVSYYSSCVVCVYKDVPLQVIGKTLNLGSVRVGAELEVTHSMCVHMHVHDINVSM